MYGKTAPAPAVTPEEAIKLFSHAKTEEMYRAMELYEAYRGAKEVRYSPLWDLLDTWDILRLLSFVYDTGRVQGIREERARKRGL